MKIIIRNIDLLRINNGCYNALKHSTGIPGALRMKLDSIIDELDNKLQSFLKTRAKLITEKVQKGKNGLPDIDETDNGELVKFNSNDDMQEFLEFLRLEHTFELDVLTRQEVGRLVTETDDTASAYDHFLALKLVTDCFAETEDGKQADGESETETAPEPDAEAEPA
jgi:hypothetical protein